MANEITKVTDQNGVDHPFKDVSAFPRSEQAVLGAKNRLNFNINYLKTSLSSGTWTGNTYVQSGLTLDFSVDDDGYITQFVASGTPSTDVTLSLADITSLPYGSYKFVGTANGWGSSSFYLGLRVGWTKFFAIDALTKIFTKDASNDWNGVYIQFKTTYDGQARTFIPQILLPTDNDLTFTPFTMTNEEITEQLTPVHTEATASTGTGSGDVSLNEANYKSIVKVGKVVFFNVRFTLNTVTGTGDTRLVNLRYVPDASYPLVTLRKRQAPYEEVCGLYINLSGEVTSYGIALPPDDYWISGTYICK